MPSISKGVVAWQGLMPIGPPKIPIKAVISEFCDAKINTPSLGEWGGYELSLLINLQMRLTTYLDDRSIPQWLQTQDKAQASRDEDALLVSTAQNLPVLD